MKVTCPKSMALTLVPGVREVWRVRHIERLDANLGRDRLRSGTSETDWHRDSHIRAHDSRSLWMFRTAAAVTGANDVGSNQWTARSDSAQHLERLDFVGALRVTRRVQRCAVGGDGHGRAGKRREICVDLPASENGGGNTLGQIAPARRRRAIRTTPRGRACSETTLEAGPSLRYRYSGIRMPVAHASVPFAYRVGGGEGQPVGEAAIHAHLK